MSFRFLRQRLLIFLVPCLVPVGSTVALPGKNGDRDGGGTVFFERRVRPILVEHCYECHSEEGDERKGGLLLDREKGWLEGGDSGKAVVPRDLEASLLIAAVRHGDEDTAMPPKYRLEDAEVKLLEQWIRRGAPGPAGDMGETEFSKLGDQEHLFEKAKDHWAFQPVDPAKPPEGVHPDWKKNPVDRFVFAKLKENGLRPSPQADSRTLTRRLAYDLTGLPPWEDAMFDLEPAELVEHLLDSPRFGEHFARMWLDVARYADTANSYRPDTKTPHYYPYAFTYRDYVIEAFNADKPYDRFIREQLAADLMGLADDAPELAALGFIGVSPHRRMGNDFVDDVIDATSRGFLGMTAACSRCHDHKFEPIPTTDYYALHGIFNSVTRAEPWKLDAFPVVRGYQPDPKTRAAYEKTRAEIDAEIVAAGNKKSGGNRRSVADTIRQTKLAELLLTHDGAPARAMAISETQRPVEPAVFIRGDPANRGESVPRRFLAILDPELTPFSAENSGRLDLADRIADPENPLTARVFVNRVWGVLMGGYLVETPSDFGLQGSRPSHPELLDWLAADFIAHGWSLKHLVRTIVSTRTYAQRSTVRPELAEVDSGNRLLARANAKRLEIEELRDSLLAVSGQLDPRMRGRSGPLWGADDGEAKAPSYTRRRSIYGYINRFNLDPTLRSFDFPSPVQSQEKRTESIVAPQVLFTMNAPFVIDQAKALIAQLAFPKGMTRPQRVDAIFQAVLHRPADQAEQERVSRFVDLEKNRGGNAWPLVAQALFMSNEFLYVD